MTAGLLAILFDIVTPVLVCAGVGYAWSRAGKPYDKAMIGNLVMFIGMPCLVFSSLVSIDVKLDELADMAFASLASGIVFLVVGWVVLRTLRLPPRTYLNAIVFANTGNMALPLCLLAFGEHGLALGIGYFVVNLVLLVTIGILIASHRYDTREILRQPFNYTVIAAIFFMVTEIPVPEPVMETTKLLGSFSIPLMLITLGVSISELKLESIPRSVLIAFLRFAIGLSTGFGLAALLGMTGTERGVFVVMCSMPVAVIAYLMAETYGGDGRPIAGAVIVSTLLSFVMLPVLLWVLLN